MVVADSEAVTSAGREMFGSPSSSLSSEVDEEWACCWLVGSDKVGMVLLGESPLFDTLLAMLLVERYES